MTTAGPILICDERDDDLAWESRVLHRAGLRSATVAPPDLCRRVVERHASIAVLGQGVVDRASVLCARLRQHPGSRSVGLLAVIPHGYTGGSHGRLGANRVLRAPISPWRFLEQIWILLAVPPRHRVDFDVFLRRPGGELCLARAVNGSDSGLLVRCEEGLAVDDVCRAYMLLPSRVTKVHAKVVRHAREAGPDCYGLALAGSRDGCRQAMAPALEEGVADVRAACPSFLDLAGDLPLSLDVDPAACDRWVPLNPPLRLVALMDGTRTARQVARQAGLTSGEMERWMRLLIRADALEMPG